MDLKIFSYQILVNKYRMTQKSLVITRMFRFKPANQFPERYHGVLSCTLNIEDLFSNIFLEIQWVIQKLLSYFIVQFTNQLLDFRVTLYNKQTMKIMLKLI
jgi:hypothetical protein